jgi:hypothetical protein
LPTAPVHSTEVINTEVINTGLSQATVTRPRGQLSDLGGDHVRE